MHHLCATFLHPAGRLALRDASQTGRAGGVYIPPFKLKQMQEQMNRDSADPAWQRMQWEALRKSINGLVNKVPYRVLGGDPTVDKCGVGTFVLSFSPSSTHCLCRTFSSFGQVNTGNITHLVPEFFAENLIAGRGLVCRSIMKAQLASSNFSHVYAGLISIINTKMPEVGELLLRRLVVQFRRAYKRNDKVICAFDVSVRKLLLVVAFC